jgi:hypothetical protein
MIISAKYSNVFPDQEQNHQLQEQLPLEFLKREGKFFAATGTIPREKLFLLLP